MMNFQHKTFAVVGVTGMVGSEMLTVLQEEGVAADHIFGVASQRSAGNKIPYKESSILAYNLEIFNFANCDFALFSAGAAVSSVYALKAEAAGCWVIDNTSFFRMHPEIALIIPEINFESILSTKRRIISNPNCSTIQMLMALAPIDRVSEIQKVVVATYQAVSGAGRLAVEELRVQERGLDSAEGCATVKEEPAPKKRFPRPIFENIIPQIDAFCANGATKEEMKMVNETCKILQRTVPVYATCVRVPVVRGHSEAVYFELAEDIPVETLMDAMAAFPGVVVERDFQVYQTPIEISGKNAVYVSRLRKQAPKCYQMWVVSDNIRKGAALNAVQIAKRLSEEEIESGHGHGQESE